MVKVNLKNKLAFLNKSKAINLENNILGLEENINTQLNSDSRNSDLKEILD